MAWQNIPTNPYWQYDDNPPNPGGAQTALWQTSTNGIRTSVRGDEIYVNCRHRFLHPTQASIPSEINKTFWSSNFSAEAQNYFDRLTLAGDTTYVAYKQPLANYIDGLVALGGAYWNTMVSACIYVGVGIQGITVPLREGMEIDTNVSNNFVAGDLNQLTGLKGDGATKYIDTGSSENAVGKDNIAMSVYVTEFNNTSGYNIIGSTGGGKTGILLANVNGDGVAWCRNGSATTFTPASEPNFCGVTRSSPSSFYLKNGNNTGIEITKASGLPAVASNVTVFAAAGGVTATDNRIAAYTFGPFVPFVPLKDLQETLLAQIAAI